MPSRAGAHRLGALLVGVAFSGLLLLNLLVPVAKGPYDNGDFKRIFATFSSGPRDLAFWPGASSGGELHRRFSYYHRYWRLDGGVAGAALPSTSNLLFSPARVVRTGQPDGLFDLALNGAYLSLLLGTALFASLATLRAPVPFAALSLLALLMSDANVAGYVGSFYQESGAFAYSLLYMCALYAFWQRRTGALLLAAVASCALLAGTKLAYAPTCLVLIAPVLAGIATSPWPPGRRRRLAAWSAATIVGAVGGSLWLLSDRTISQAAAYIFVFTTALPSLPPADRAPYLASLGVDPSYVAEAGKGAFETDARPFSDPRLNEQLGTSLLRRAVVRLAIDHPRVALHLLREAGSHAGTYPPLMYESDPARKPGPVWTAWHGWSAIHAWFLHGWPLYATGLVLWVALGWSLLRRPTDGWPLFFWVVTASFLGGSILQALISMFGNGLVDAERHNYLATMLLDAALVSAGAGLWQQRGARRSSPTSQGSCPVAALQDSTLA